MMAWDVAGIGASCVDQVCRLPVFPEAGGPRAKVRMQDQTRTCGGQIATALATCASLGLRTTYLGAVGEDDDGRRIRSELAARGINLEHIVVSAAPTATAAILLDATGDRIVLWHRDPALRYPPDRLPAAVIAASRVLHVDDVDVPAAIEAAKIARAHGIPVTCDIDHVTPGTRELLQLVSHPVFAESVPMQLTGVSEPERALRALRRAHPGRLVVTVGERGAIALDGDSLLAAPGFPVTVVDSTGAGDVFRGAYIYGIVKGWSLERQLWFANAAAAVSCTKSGAMGGVPVLAEVEDLLARRS
jgi:sugar/nucleoside kinase (ribokinase family)